jgi:hypothetical protein
MFERFADAPGIAKHDPCRTVDDDLKCLLLVGHAAKHGLPDRAAQAAKVDPLAFENDPAGVAAVSGRDVVDQLGQARDGFEDCADIVRRSGASCPAYPPLSISAKPPIEVKGVRNS